MLILLLVFLLVLALLILLLLVLLSLLVLLRRHGLVWLRLRRALRLGRWRVLLVRWILLALLRERRDAAQKYA